MLRLVLDDLEEQRAALCEALETAASVKPRTDFVDCWNLIDEISEHERRIATLRRIIDVDRPRRAKVSRAKN